MLFETEIESTIYLFIVFYKKREVSTHLGQVVGSEGTGLFVCMRRTHFAGTMGKLVHTKLSEKCKICDFEN